MRRLLLYISCICLALLSYLQVRAERIDTLLHFNLADLQIDTVTAPDGQSYTKLFYSGCGEEERAGVPSLPIKYIRFSLPDNAGDISVNVGKTKTISHPVSFELYPVQPAIPYSLSLPKKASVFRDSVIYSTDASYPVARAYVKRNIRRKNGERFADVAVFPVVYNPIDKEYMFCEDVSISLDYTVSTYNITQTNKSRYNTPSSGLPYYEYCVITCDSLKDSFTRLVAWQRQKGLDAGVVCVEDILSNTVLLSNDETNNFYDPGPYSHKQAGMVRQYLREAVINEEITKYVLLGGDYTIIPTRFAKRNDNIGMPNLYQGSDFIPSDWYYSELSSTWQRQNVNTVTGDLSSEANVAVGRILCTTPQDVENYTNKLLRYEMNPGNGSTSYLTHALYVQADQGQQHDEARRVAAIDSSVYSTRTIMEEHSSYNSYNPTSPSGNTVIYRLNRFRCGYASFYVHGDPYIMKTMTRGINNEFYENFKRTNALTSIQGIKSLSSSVDIVTESSNGFDKMDNKLFPMFMYSCSCTSMPFDECNVYNFLVDVPNIGKSLTTGGDYGCAAYVGNTRFGIINWSSILQGLFNQEILDHPIGTALNRAKDLYFDDATKEFNQYLMLTTNLLGSPNMNLWTARPSSYNVTYGINGVLSFNESPYWAKCFIRDISAGQEPLDILNCDNAIGELEDTIGCSHLITIRGKNYLPKILPLYIKGKTLHGKHYLFTKDVVCIKNESNTIFDTDADYTFENSGTFRIDKGVTIKRGAHVRISSSEINY